MLCVAMHSIIMLMVIVIMLNVDMLSVMLHPGRLQSCTQTLDQSVNGGK
jgi:hypothetical protein